MRKTKKLMWTNVGGYAKEYGTVNLGDTAATTASHKINGLGGYADGTSAVVNLYGTSNTINTGSAGTLVAKNSGKVNYYGGTITHKDNGTVAGKNDHDNTTPFYAVNNGQVLFHGASVLDMHDGVLITGANSDYVSAIDNTSKYQGLNNLTVNIHGDNVTLGSFSGMNLKWDDRLDSNQTYQNGLPGISKFAGGKVNLIGNATYKFVLINGTLEVSAPTVTLDDSLDLYNGLQMANELVTIKNTSSVTGNIGAGSLADQGKAQGISMGNISTAVQISAGILPSNATSGFVNEGTVNVTGGTAAKGIAGINVSYGTAENRNMVTVDNGAGLYGTNGSRLVNSASGVINVTSSGVGISGIGTGNTLQGYGTDDPLNASFSTAPTVEIENHGTVNVSGDKAIGIFAKNNTGASRSRVTVKNSSPITVGREGVGIAIVSEAPPASFHGAEDGGTLTASASGTGNDITAGIEGKGIFVKNSDINLVSGDYVIETGDDGSGIFASGDTEINGTLEYRYNGSSSKTGMGIVYDQKDTAGNPINIENRANVKLNNVSAATGGMIGVYTLGVNGTSFTNTGDITGSSAAKEFGIISNGADIINKGNITLGDALSQTDANVAVYSRAANKTVNEADITVGKNAVGIYGYGVVNSGVITAGDNGTAIYTVGDGSSVSENIKLESTSVLNIADNQGVGVYSAGKNQTITAEVGSVFNIGKDSFGFVNVGMSNTVISNSSPLKLSDDGVYIYQNDRTGKVFNNTELTSTGSRNYGIYGNGEIENNADIDFRSGAGNVAVYSTGEKATNYRNIKVSGTNLSSKLYGVGMATGYYDKNASTPFSNQGTVINRGVIEVSQPNSIGMYAVGPRSKAINYGHINLMSDNAIGMYVDQGAQAENWGTIQTTAAGLKQVKGIYLANGSYIKNYGTINIEADDVKSAGIWSDKESESNAAENAQGTNPVTMLPQTGTSTPAMKVVSATDMKEMGGVTVKVPVWVLPVYTSLL